MRRGLALVVSAPSGAGKTTLCRRLLAEDDSISFSVSYTTRPPRAKERPGVDYFFVSRKTFEEMIKAGAFLEWAEVHGNLYGTSKGQVLEALEAGRDVLLDIDVQGAAQVKEILGRDAVLVFVLPPGFEELERRLRKRSTEDEATIRKRLENARKELAQAQKFEYLVLNDDLETAFRELKAILEAERQRTFRRQDLLRRFS
jgi:guanylate kinase